MTRLRSLFVPGAWARGGSERGASLVIVALAMFVLFGGAGLGIDAGRIFAERRDAQGAADQAAVAAAYSLCAGGTTTTAAAAAQASATRNGYSSGVTVTTISTTRIQVTVNSVVPGTFSSAIGLTSFPVTVTAAAECAGTTVPGPGVLAGGTDCGPDTSKYTFDVSGSWNRVYGGVHSNYRTSLGTTPNWWTDDGVGDPFTYSVLPAPSNNNQTYPTTSNSANVFQSGYPQRVDQLAWPTGFAPADVPTKLTTYRTAAQASTTDNLYYINGDLTSITNDGLYYVTGKIDVSNFSRNMNVTLIAEGDIKLSASGFTISPFRDGILAFSGKVYGFERCDKFTIAISGSSATWNGLMWAPGGLIEFSGSSNLAVTGTLIGWAIRLNGSNLTFNMQGLDSNSIDVLLVN